MYHVSHVSIRLIHADTLQRKSYSTQENVSTHRVYNSDFVVQTVSVHHCDPHHTADRCFYSPMLWSMTPSRCGLIT